MRVLNEGCVQVRRGVAFFLSEPEDRLRLNFPTLIQPCYPSANVFTLLLATFENMLYTYIWEGLRLVGCGLEMRINTLKPGRLN